jgi:hypothetical protein
MGDDSVEGYVEDAKLKYGDLGHECKDYVACEVTSCYELKGVNFCSHYFGNGTCWLTSWPKTLVKFFSSPNPQYSDLSAELKGNPLWGKISRYVCRVGLGPDKDGEEEKITDKQTEQNGPCPSGGGDCVLENPPPRSTQATGWSNPNGDRFEGFAEWLLGGQSDGPAGSGWGNPWSPET